MTREASMGWTEVVTLGRQRIAVGAIDSVDGRIAAVSDVQHGVISIAQLAGCGLSASAARSRVAAGSLHRVQRGVYTPGHPRLPPFGAVAGAVLSRGLDASACHLTSAALREVRADGRTLIDVACRSATGRAHGKVVTHSSRGLRPQDVEVVNGIPATSLARTLLDCAPIVGRRGTEQMIQKAEWQGAFDLVAIRDLLAHVPGHTGAATLRAAIGDAAGAQGAVASGVEDDLLVAFRDTGLREPECNAAIALGDGTYAYPDFLWRAEGLAVEADPRATHDRTASYRSDRRRDRALRRLAEVETMRFCDQDLADPVACAVEVSERLMELATRHDFRPLSGRKS